MLRLPSNLWLVGGLAVLVLVLGAGTAGFFYGAKYGTTKTTVKWNADISKMQEKFAERQLAVAKLQNDYDVVDWRLKYEYEPKLKAANQRADDLARQLRRFFKEDAARNVRVPAAPSPASGDDGASGDGSGDSPAGGGVIEAINVVLAACQRDAIRLNWWIEREAALQKVEADGEIWLEVK
jgi:hypothetical protein